MSCREEGSIGSCSIALMSNDFFFAGGSSLESASAVFDLESEWRHFEGYRRINKHLRQASLQGHHCQINGDLFFTGVDAREVSGGQTAVLRLCRRAHPWPASMQKNKTCSLTKLRPCTARCSYAAISKLKLRRKLRKKTYESPSNYARVFC